MYSRHQLADGFRAIGVRAGDTVMVHASVRAVGPVAGGPDQIHLALKDVLTASGTLLMYASCPEHFDEIGRGNLRADQERELLEKLPAFDPLTARCARDNGALVELLRTFRDLASTRTSRALSCGDITPRTSTRRNRGTTPSAAGPSLKGLSSSTGGSFC